LRSAPGFAASDFRTRADYRAQIEVLSRGSGRSEIEVARESLLLAGHAAREDAQAAAAGEEADSRERAPGLPDAPKRAEEDPGYYLLSRGRRAFERRLGFRVPLRIRLSRFHRAHATAGYLGSVAFLTALLLSGLLFFTWTAGVGLPALVLLGILGVVPASEIAVSLVHRLVPMLVQPRLLPKLDLARGVPPELRTVVVVPMLLTSRDEVDEQVERLEVHYLANPEGDLHPATRISSQPWPTALLASTRNTRVNREPGAVSSCCIVDASGTRKKVSGSAGKGSEASSTS
ncbi:MAG: hypothetical protein P8Y10_16440, partial [Gemmatimonadales bacterium]